MAKHAVNMRMDMSSILGMAQDLWTPEKAIETAAELQVLGGNFAREFGDPFKLMYAARNEPHKLVESMEKAIESVYQFNDATGEFESSGFEMQRLQIAAQKLGLDFQQLNKSAMQAAKSTVIDSQINFTATDEEKAFLANVAQIGAGGAATVKIAGEEIKVEDLGRERLEQLQESTIENEQDYFESSMKQYQTQTDVLTGIRELAKAQLASSKLNLFLNAEKLLKGTTQEVGGFANMFGDDAKKGDFTKTIGKITNVFNTMGSAMGVDNVMGMFNNITKDDDSVGGNPAQGAKPSKTYTTAQRTAATQQALNKIANMGVKHSGTVKHTMHVTVGPGVTAPLQAAMVSQGIPYLESTGGSYTTHGPEENKSSK